MEQNENNRFPQIYNLSKRMFRGNGGDECFSCKMFTNRIHSLPISL